MIRTKAATDIGEYRDGYMSNVSFTAENQYAIEKLQSKIGQILPDVVWLQPKESLHVTLFDFIAPKVKYDVDRAILYEKQKELINQVLAQLVLESDPFSVVFDEVCISPSAVYIKGKDDGGFARIRDRFLQLYPLDERTKKPPTIIHSTVARFTDEINLENVESILSQLSINVALPINSFRLVHEQQIPMLRYKVLSEYSVE
jgi:hypothetical protein